MRRINPLVFFLLIALVGIAAHIVPPLQIRATTNIIDLKQESSMESAMVSCVVGSTILKDRDPDEVEFRFFAKNNFNQHVFELTDENYNPLKVKLNKAPSGEWLVFRASFKDLFFKEPVEGPFRWTWMARPAPPVSPLVSRNDQAVSSIQCWCTLTVKNKSFKSKPIKLNIKQ